MSCRHPNARLCICSDCGLDLGAALAAERERTERAEAERDEFVSELLNDAGIDADKSWERLREKLPELPEGPVSLKGLREQLAESRAEAARLRVQLELAATPCAKCYAGRPENSLYCEDHDALASPAGKEAIEAVRMAAEALAYLEAAAVVERDPVRFICPPAFEKAVRTGIRALAALDKAFLGVTK